MKRYNVCTKSTYQVGKEIRQRWNQVGSMVEFSKADGDDRDGHILELHMHPETKFYLLKQEPPEPGSNG